MVSGRLVCTIDRLVLLVEYLYGLLPGFLLAVAYLSEMQHTFLDIPAAGYLSLLNDTVILVVLAILFTCVSFQIHAPIIASKNTRSRGQVCTITQFER